MLAWFAARERPLSPSSESAESSSVVSSADTYDFLSGQPGFIPGPLRLNFSQLDDLSALARNVPVLALQSIHLVSALRHLTLALTSNVVGHHPRSYKSESLELRSLGDRLEDFLSSLRSMREEDVTLATLRDRQGQIDALFSLLSTQRTGADMVQRSQAMLHDLEDMDWEDHSSHGEASSTHGLHEREWRRVQHNFSHFLGSSQNLSVPVDTRHERPDSPFSDHSLLGDTEPPVSLRFRHAPSSSQVSLLEDQAEPQGSITWREVRLNNFMIGALVPVEDLLTEQPNLELRISTEMEEIETGLHLSMDSDGIWIAEGNIDIPTAERWVKIALVINMETSAVELSSAFLLYSKLSKHIRGRPKKPYEILMKELYSASTPFLLSFVPSNLNPQEARNAALRRSDMSSRIPPPEKMRFVNPAQAAALTDESFRSMPDSEPLDPDLREKLEDLYDTAANRVKDECMPKFFNAAGYGYLKAYRDTNNFGALNRAISIFEEGLRLTPFLDPERGEYLTDISAARLTRFNLTGDMADFDAALSDSRDALQLMDDDHKYKPQSLNIYAVALNKQFERSGNLADIDTAIANWEQAIALTPPDESLAILNNLGCALLQRYRRFGQSKDLEAAIVRLELAVKLETDKRPDKAAVLANLANGYEARFNLQNRIDDLEAAITHHKKAIRSIPDGQPNKPALLSNFGNALESRFDQSNQPRDLEEAIIHKQLAIHLTMEKSLDRPTYLGGFGDALQTRFDRSGDVDDLEAAIFYKRLAIDLAPDDHTDNANRFSKLGEALEARFKRLGNIVDLRASIFHRQMAVQFASDKYPSKPFMLVALANALETRFDQLGAVGDLKAAIFSRCRAVQLIPKSHTCRAILLNDLSAAFRRRFELLGDPKDLSKAISSLEQSIRYTPEGHPDKSIRMGHLNKMLINQKENQPRDNERAEDMTIRHAAIPFTWITPKTETTSLSDDNTEEEDVATEVHSYEFLVSYMPHVEVPGHIKYNVAQVSSLVAISKTVSSFSLQSIHLAVALKHLTFALIDAMDELEPQKLRKNGLELRRLGDGLEGLFSALNAMHPHDRNERTLRHWQNEVDHHFELLCGDRIGTQAVRDSQMFFRHLQEMDQRGCCSKGKNEEPVAKTMVDLQERTNEYMEKSNGLVRRSTFSLCSAHGPRPISQSPPLRDYGRCGALRLRIPSLVTLMNY